MGNLRQFFDSVLNGREPDDPLYLSNRTLWKKFLTVALIAIPCGLLVGLLALSLSGYFRGKENPYAPGPSPPQVASSAIPGVDKNLSLPANRDLEVVDIRIEHQEITRVAGTIRNNTNRPIPAAEVVFDLLDRPGTRLGAVSAKVKSLAPHGTASFEFPIVQRTAVTALVREIHGR
jgi:hypothetical protein